MSLKQTATFDVPEYDPDRMGSYRPRIKPEQLRRLWVLKQHTDKPMTLMVAEALERYFSKYWKGGDDVHELGNNDP